ncbi:hypothetical protein STEG23_012561 [Scotinomys teguina]
MQYTDKKLSMKEVGGSHKQWRGRLSSTCKQCPVAYASPVCGSDGYSYSSQCKLEYQACVLGKQISIRCEGRCPCPSDKSTSTGRNVKRVPKAKRNGKCKTQFSIISNLQPVIYSGSMS